METTTQLDFVTIRRYGADLIVPGFTVDDLPTERQLPIDKVPTFCGAGGGIGDWAVSDTICGVRVAIVCYFHDLEWSGIFPRSFDHFRASNSRFFDNLLSLVRTHVDTTKYSEADVNKECTKYYLAVMTAGWHHYEDNVQFDCDPGKHPVYRDKNQRLWRPVLR